MKIPKNIVPCPLQEVIMEIRFETTYDEATVLGIIYSQIKEEFNKVINLPILEIPSSMRKKDPNLRFIPYYRIISKNSENEMIQVGPQVFSISITKDYPGWESFYEKIKYAIKKFEITGLSNKITRVALRYVNFFQGNILSKTNLSIDLNGQVLKNYKTTINIEIPDEEYTCILNASNMAMKQENGKIITGSIIDIDTFIQGEISNFYINSEKIINDCHDVEKKLFASLLNEDYIRDLTSIEYA